MPWSIDCCNKACGKTTRVANIVDLLNCHRNELGWFRCNCGSRGCIEKRFKLQEGEGETWEPYLKGAIRLTDDPCDTYQPFVFLVGYAPNEEPTDVWFSYYKDLRRHGGRLKLGYGPGGPPVLRKGATCPDGGMWS